MTHSKRPETGPMQFGDDWPGVFMRGDNAVTASILLLEALSKIQRTGVLDALELAQLHGLARDLGSADVRAGAPVQQLQSWDQCVRLGTMSKTTEGPELVNHPSHYNQGGPLLADGTSTYECIKIVEDWGLGFCMGNALKYILRAPHKGTEKQDLAKARWYLARNSDQQNVSAAVVPVPAGPAPRMTTWHLESGSPRKFEVEAVCSAWGLPESLSQVVLHIRQGDGKQALAALDLHLASNP